jgi:uncharacterized protein (DUF1499 family)
MKWTLWTLLIVAIPLALVIGALRLNRAPLFEPPGLWQRLALYLTTNVAETRTDHPHAELRPLRLPLNMARAQTLVVTAMADLGWEDIRVNPEGGSAVVTSGLFGFKDDVAVRLEATSGAVFVNVRSASRRGRGDFAANTRHVQRLFERLRAY